LATRLYSDPLGELAVIRGGVLLLRGREERGGKLMGKGKEKEKKGEGKGVGREG